MIRHRWKLVLSLLLSLLFLVIVAVLIIDWAVETPAEQREQEIQQREQEIAQLDQEIAQLDQEIQLKPPPAYEIADESDSSAFSCEPEDLGYNPSVCLMVLTEATGAMKLASITEDMINNPVYMTDYGLVLRVRFLDKSEFDEGRGSDIATGYCFKRKSVAVSALGSALKDAELLGKADYCYLTLYREGDAELLKPFH